MIKAKNNLLLRLIVSIFITLSLISNFSDDYNGMISSIHDFDFIFSLIIAWFNYTLVNWVYFNHSKFYDSNILIKFVTALTIIVMAFYYVTGRLIEQYGQLADVKFSLVLVSIIIIKVISLSVIGITVLNFLIVKIVNYIKTDRNKNLNDNHSRLKFSFGKVFLLFLIGWLPYIIINYPGVVSWDTQNQLFEFFNVTKVNGHQINVKDTYPIAHYLQSSSDLSITNQHNFLVTILYGTLQKVGLLYFNSSNMGFLLVSIFQILLMIGCITYMLKVIFMYSGDSKIYRYTRNFYLFCPIFPMITMCHTKNVIYAGLLLMFIAMLVELYFKHDIVNRMWWNILFASNSIMQLVTQKYAFYVLVVTGIIWFLITKNKKKIFVYLLFPVMFVHYGMIYFVMPTFNITRDDPIEGYGLPMEQTALYLKKYPNDISKTEYQKINNVFNPKRMVSNYNPNFTDPLKSSGQFSEKGAYKYKTVKHKDVSEYKTVWIKLMKRHPDVFLLSFINLGYKYLDVGSRQPNVILLKGTSDQLPITSSFQKDNGAIFKTEYGQVSMNPIKRLDKVRELLVQLMNLLNSIFVTAVLFNGNILILIIIVTMLLVLNICKRWSIVGIYLPLIIQIPIYMISPVNGSQRYMYPVVFCGVMLISVGILIITLLSKHSGFVKND